MSLSCSSTGPVLRLRRTWTNCRSNCRIRTFGFAQTYPNGLKGCPRTRPRLIRVTVRSLSPVSRIRPILPCPLHGRLEHQRPFQVVTIGADVRSVVSSTRTLLVNPAISVCALLRASQAFLGVRKASLQLGSGPELRLAIISDSGSTS